ncbi:MAG: PH domain-containing protein [Candidatus Yonathbacteria bacterium]|nr:PH domain-containing protein [Candidatus Yonathbacteria bacterium]
MIALDNDETIILEVRKHWFIFMAQSLPLIFLIFFPFIVKIILSVTGLSDIVVFGKHAQTFITIITTMWVWFIWVAFFILWTDYYLDILILTNKRIIEIEQKALFVREISTFRLDRIQDITVEVSGVIPTFFSFGDIHIQTAGEVPEISVKSIPDPHKVREIVSRAQDEAIDKSRVVKIDGAQ